MKRAFIKWMAAGCLGFCFGGNVSAQLLVGIDAERNVLTILGSDTGNPFRFDTGDGVFANFTGWRDAGGNSGSNQALDLSSGLNSPFDVANLFVNTAGQVSIELSLLGEELPNGTVVTGLDVEISYGALTPERQAVLEAAVGTTLPVFTGSGWQQVQVAAVPEPRAVGCLAVAGGIGFLLRRRLRFS